jgi:multidrug efflux pump subunit AcrB
VRDIESSDKEGKNQSVLSFDYDRLAELGLQAADVGLTLRTALEGTVVSRTYTPEEKIDYRVMLQKKFRQAPKDLLRLSVLNNERRLVPIQQAVKLTQSVAPAKIEHFNYDRVTFVTANVDSKQSSIQATTQKVKTFLDDLAKQHPGFTYEIGGEASQSAEAFRDVGIVFLLALGLIAIILVLQFNSFLQPLIIMVSIPFGIVGVIWTFALHGLTFSFLSVIGVVGLSGIVVNDALLMIDTMNALIRKKGCRTLEQYREAAVEAAVMRFRPIAITTVTTLAGVLPTAYGWGGYVESIATMVLGLGWGLLFAALLSLFLVPGLFLLMAEFEQWLAARLPWLPIRNQCQVEE